MNKFIKIIGGFLRTIPVIKNCPKIMPRDKLISRSVDHIVDEVASGLEIDRLLKIMKYYGLNIKKYRKDLVEEILFILSFDKISVCQRDKYNILFESYECSLMNAKHWMRIYEMFCYKGLYYLGYHFREKARVNQLKSFSGPLLKMSSVSKNAVVSAAIDGGECLDPKELDELMNQMVFMDEDRAKWRSLVGLLNGSRDYCNNNRFVIDNEFASYISGKTIAVVGPAKTNSADAKEIDGFDLIVRLNYSYSGKGCDPLYKGMRTDITYFNSEQAKVLIEENNRLLPDDIVYACFKKDQYSASVEFIKEKQFCRDIIMFDDLSYHGTYNMMPLVLMDLCVHNPKTIKVFHTDLMLTVDRNSGYYPMSFKREKEALYRVFRLSSIMHDPVIQYRVLFRLWSRGLINGDLRFNEVMSMGEKKYLMKLELIYSDCYSDSFTSGC